ncbi:WXG100-like domain-containing protein [Nocardia pseudobrasiliensis]|uniref:Outer membrane channel protein CpnT-like N-terminal domain-containing protein n=1 Tax=Nocardia pseudobrasiliensis TaxID=45979 RepID=A0A370HKC8_9NOCA|nr:hypothetical protein [Nocardia pseudobrasiliensis]RDI59036.1 hypothetical protein DFR76_12039 [Nocardia pseudobrasiliensis]
MTAPTVPLIVCRGDEYHSAGEVFGQMATDTLTTHSALVTVLTNHAGMAGDDSVGQQWANSYDEAAQLAISTSSKLTTSCGQVRDLIVLSAYNHQVAETTANLKNTPPPPAPQLSPDPCPPETTPSAAGSGIPEPFGWSIIKDAVGMAWPDGHQDQLNTAAAAWHTAASDYRTVAAQTPQAVDLLRNQQSPEIDIAAQTCTDRQTDLTALADACQTLGDACGNYAHHLDEAHSQILHELRELTLEAAAGEAAFALLIPFTGSLSEWIGNSALAARIATKARRIATIITELATKATKIVTDAIKPMVERLKPLLERVRTWVEAARTKLNPIARPGSTAAITDPAVAALPEAERAVALSARDIFTSPEFEAIRAAQAEGKAAEVTINGTKVLYEPDLPASGFTLFGEHGFVIGREAFTSEAELAKTVAHESHRLATSSSASGVSGELATNETDAAFNFAETTWKFVMGGS